MNAMAVPPPGWTPFEDPGPARGTSRRNIKQGLALSALVHLSALACILWIQAQHSVDETAFTDGRVDLVPPFVRPGPQPPVVRTTPTTHPDRGIYEPAPIVDEPTIDLPKVDPRGGLTSGEGPNAKPTKGDDGSSTGAPAVADPDPPEGLFVAFDEPPVPIVHPDPVYPDWARENGIEGRVVLHALIGADGRVRRITVIRGNPALSESAAETLRHWTFRPATSSHQPVAVWIEVPFLFRL
jgi:periplasmic protein TonB